MEKAVIVGLGYVGLPLLTQAVSQGMSVKGYDVDEEKVESLEEGKSPIDDERLKEEVAEYVEPEMVSGNEEVLDAADYYIITVPTPVNGKEPDYSYVKSASETVAEHLEEGATVVLESTVAPGTCRKVVKPILEKSGLEVGKDIHLAFCPERVDPGNEEWTIRNIPRVLGAYSDSGRKKAKEFYDEALEAEIFEASSLEVAEASKVTENAFRDINIAYVNELAKIFDSIDVDAKEVIEAADTKPFGFMAHWPGCGVGGHCIPVDPYFLIKESSDHGHNPRLLSEAREINESMPEYTVQKVMESLNQIEKPVKNTEIALLGLAYKSGVDDMRRSPAISIKNRLENLGAKVRTYDPYLPDESDMDSLEKALDKECVVIATDHEEFKDLENMETGQVGCIIDGKNMLDEEELDAIYQGIGK